MKLFNRKCFRRNNKTIPFLLVIIFFILYSLNSLFYKVYHTESHYTYVNFIRRFDSPEFVKLNGTKIKYILQWTSPKNVPFIYMGVGQKNFIDRKCSFVNCYVTSDMHLLGDVTKFDAVVFAGPELVFMSKSHMPLKRSPHQKYVFASIESPHNYPLCSKRFDNFFNWTWTYKLNSDARWGYIIVRDAKGKIIGPNTNMNWITEKDMLPVTNKLKRILRGKRKAAAWFVSNCNTASQREQFALNLRDQLWYKYNLNLDIYGTCGEHQCPRDHKKCYEMIRRDYFFYLSLENSFSDDYVTEKLINAVAYNAVPIVYGGANYSRFLPSGSYLDGSALGVEAVAAKINKSMHDLELYSEYFRWTAHYSYEKKGTTAETDDYCGFCELLNDDVKVNKTKIYKDFHQWWDSFKGETVCTKLLSKHVY